MSNTRCVLPFNTLSIGSQGNIRVCCSSVDNNLLGYHLILDMPGGEWQRIQPLEDIRQAMLRGEKPPICNRCWKNEEINASSIRNTFNNYFSERRDQIDAGNTEVVLERLEVDLGTKCNLSCRMCHPGSSSLMQEELLRNPTRQWIKPINQPKDWFASSTILDYIAKHGHNLKIVYMIGGEPLIIDAHMVLLQHLIDLGFSKNIKLSYSTNLMNVGVKFYEIWKNFKEIDLGVSVDSSEKQYEYIRYPATWEKLTRNLTEVIRVGHTTLGHLQPGIHSTVSALTMPHLVRSLKIYLDEFKLRTFLINVDRPEEMYSTMIPEQPRKQIAKELLEYCNVVERRQFNYSGLVSKAKELYEAPNPRPEQIRAFMKHMKYMDIVHNQLLFDYYTCFDEWRDIYESIE